VTRWCTSRHLPEQLVSELRRHGYTSTTALNALRVSDVDSMQLPTHALSVQLRNALDKSQYFHKDV
jgi:hypothetical protein